MGDICRECRFSNWDKIRQKLTLFMNDLEVGELESTEVSRIRDATIGPAFAAFLGGEGGMCNRRRDKSTDT